MGKDCTDVRKPESVQRLSVFDVLEHRGTHGLELPELIRLDPVGGEGRGLIHVLDDLVQGLEWDGAVPEDLVPRRGAMEVLLEPDDRFGETFDRRDVDPFPRASPTGGRRLEVRV